MASTAPPAEDGGAPAPARGLDSGNAPDATAGGSEAVGRTDAAAGRGGRRDATIEPGRDAEAGRRSDAAGPCGDTCTDVPTPNETHRACCRASGECGLEPGETARSVFGGGCRERNRPGVLDAQCPDLVLPLPGGNSVWDGCCRTDGSCGVMLSGEEYPFGCTDSGPLIPDARCGPECDLCREPKPSGAGAPGCSIELSDAGSGFINVAAWSDGSCEAIPATVGADFCDDLPGWYGGSAGAVHLCPATCDKYGSDPEARVRVVVSSCGMLRRE